MDSKDRRYWQKFILAVALVQFSLTVLSVSLLLEWHKHSLGFGLKHYLKIEKTLKGLEKTTYGDREMLYQQWQYNQLPDVEATEDE